jgi:hypothetical protein
MSGASAGAEDAIWESAIGPRGIAVHDGLSFRRWRLRFSKQGHIWNKEPPGMDVRERLQLLEYEIGIVRFTIGQ